MFKTSVLYIICLLADFYVFVGLLVFVLDAELLLSAVVTLDSLEIYQNHEWIGSKPKVYFQCSGENKIVLPDVKKTNSVYKFKGEESFQVRKDWVSIDIVLEGALDIPTVVDCKSLGR